MMKQGNRRTGAALLAGLTALCVLTHIPAEAQVTKLRVSTVPIMDSAPLQVALAKGYFTEQGLEIDTTPTVGGATGLPAVAAGQIQIAFSNIVSTILGAKQGLGFTVIAAGSSTDANPPELGGMVARKGSNLKTGKDFEGKRVGVNTRNNINWVFIREWVEMTGGSPDKVTFLEVPFPQMIDAVRRDSVDAAMTVEPFLSAGVKGGTVDLVGWPYNVVLKRMPVAQYVATKTFIQANPDAIERFVRAYNRGVDWTNANKGTEEWVKIISGYTRMAPDQLQSITSPVFNKTVDAEGVAKIAGLMRKHGLIQGEVDVKDLLYKTAVEPVK
jgi:NitT/TauT family transport system substrate-binding protein